MNNLRRCYLVLALLTIVGGALSRMLHSGVPLLDKYLGDALYAVLVYLLLRALQPGRRPLLAALVALALMAAIESFQLTGIPAIMAHSGNFILRLAAIALGTGFHWYDLLAYAIGIMSAALADMFLLWRPLRNV